MNVQIHEKMNGNMEKDIFCILIFFWIFRRCSEAVVCYLLLFCEPIALVNALLSSKSYWIYLIYPQFPKGFDSQSGILASMMYNNNSLP